VSRILPVPESPLPVSQREQVDPMDLQFQDFSSMTNIGWLMNATLFLGK
jgi:hypothetical protein